MPTFKKITINFTKKNNKSLEQKRELKVENEKKKAKTGSVETRNIF